MMSTTKRLRAALLIKPAPSFAAAPRCFPAALPCFAAALFLGILLTATSAKALSCSPPSNDNYWFPTAGSTAPVNVKPRLHRTLAKREFATEHSKLFSDAKLYCVTPQGKKAIEVEPEYATGYRYEETVFVPEAPLPASSECALALPGDKALTWFKTSKKTDSQAPTIGTWEPSKVVSCADAWGGCPPGGGATGLRLMDVHDDSSEGQLTVSAWLAELDEDIDYTSSPDYVTLGLRWGRKGSCERQGDFFFPPYGSPKKLGFVVTDLAGNRTAPREGKFEGQPNSYQLKHWKTDPSDTLLGSIAPAVMRDGELTYLEPPGKYTSRDDSEESFPWLWLFLGLVLIVPAGWAVSSDVWEAMK